MSRRSQRSLARKTSAVASSTTPTSPPFNTTHPLFGISTYALSELQSAFMQCFNSYNDNHPDNTPLSTPETYTTSKRSVGFSSTVETATIIGSSIQRNEDEFINESGVFINSSTSPDCPPTASHIDSTPSEILPLRDRIPSIPDLLEYLKSHYRVSQILDSPNLFHNEEEKEQYIFHYFHHEPNSDDDFWSDAVEYTIESIEENIPSSRGELKKCRDSYFKDMIHLVDEHFFTREMDHYQGTAWENNLKLRNISGRIGYVFLDAIEHLITPPRGSKIQLISSQLDSCLRELEDKTVHEYFTEDVSKHVYYIAGFLCRAGEKEKERRTSKNNIGLCIGAISAHFVSDSFEIDEIKTDLPKDITAMVDKRSVYGGLKYPNLQLYSLVAKMEYCYSRLATPHNLQTFGGIVLNVICEEIAQNDNFVEHFASLFFEDAFDDTTMKKAFQYYVKVFANLRIKDLCRKFNSQLHKTTTANFRSSIATKAETKKDKIKRRAKIEEDELEMTDGEEHDKLLDIAESRLLDDFDDDDEERIK